MDRENITIFLTDFLYLSSDSRGGHEQVWIQLPIRNIGKVRLHHITDTSIYTLHNAKHIDADNLVARCACRGYGLLTEMLICLN